MSTRVNHPHPGMLDQLRAALAAEPGSLYAVAEKAGVERSSVARFVSSERGLSAATFAALAETLGFKMVRKR